MERRKRHPRARTPNCGSEEPSTKRQRRCTMANSLVEGRARNTVVRYHTNPLRTLSGLRHSGRICDGTVRTGSGRVFDVHRVMLASHSQFLKALFINSLTQGRPEISDATLHGISTKSLELIIEFIYTGNCRITTNNAQDLITAADQLGVISLIDRCSDFIADQLAVDNCISIARFSSYHVFTKLERAARRFALLNFPDVTESNPEFDEMTAVEVERLLDDDELNARREERVFESIIDWVEVDAKKRQSWLPLLLSCVRFGLTSYSYISNKVWNHELIARNQPAQAALCAPCLFLAQLESSESGSTDLAHPLARPRLAPETLFALGGWTSGSPIASIETYDVRADRWLLLPDADREPRAYHGLQVLHNRIYMIGGFDGNDNLNTMRCYDPATRGWHDCACMYTPRCFVSTCVLHGKIYAFGGYDGRTRLNTCERYDPEANQWERLPSMVKQRSDAAVVSVNGRAYIAGGFDGYQVFNSVEVYDPAGNEWSQAAEMRSARSGLSLVNYGNTLLAVGGFNGQRRLRSAEKLELGVESSWKSVANMYTPRSNFSCVLTEGSVLVVGGFNGSTTIADVEHYDLHHDRWQKRSSMNVNRSALAACVLHQLPNARDFSFLGHHQQPR